MRIFSFVFIAYLLLLSWQPCQDLAAKTDARPSAAEQAAHHSQIHDTPQQPEENDDCSPLCSCSCCQISTADARVTFALKSRFSVEIEKTAESFYQNDYSQQPLTFIWQPPKFDFTA